MRTSTTSSRRHARRDTAGRRPSGRERCDILDRAADLISERSVVDGAALAWENGKSRLEAIGEVEEAADLIRYYTHAMREHDGFDVPMQRFSEREVTTDVMRPYGVWAVIAPFNYPSALVAGPAGARWWRGTRASSSRRRSDRCRDTSCTEPSSRRGCRWAPSTSSPAAPTWAPRS